MKTSICVTALIAVHWIGLVSAGLIQLTREPTFNPTLRPTANPSTPATPAPSALPTRFPTVMPTATPTRIPTPSPTKVPTPLPSARPTPKPSASPSSNPSSLPSADPTPKPSASPSSNPSSQPTPSPTLEPTPLPSARPSARPSAAPTVHPTSVPSTNPTTLPTPSPSARPSACPSAIPTSQPTPSPSSDPTPMPSADPTPRPSARPSSSPTKGPTAAPTARPTARPSANPTPSPSARPSSDPTSRPTPSPTSEPTPSPSAVPTPEPSASPTPEPTPEPSTIPTPAPSGIPTVIPSAAPSTSPTAEPSQPTAVPTTSAPTTPSPTFFPTFSDKIVDLNNLTDNDDGFAFLGIDKNGQLGYTVLEIGDFNGDGHADYMVSAPGAPFNGRPDGTVYVVYGTGASAPSFTNLANFNSGSKGFRILGGLIGNSSGFCGFALSSGDINNDGRTDLVVSAPVATVLGRETAGITYVIYGVKGGYTTDLIMADFTSGSAGFRILGKAGTYAGYSVDASGDFNGDGLPDILLGATVGYEAYVIYGKDPIYTVDVDLASFQSGEAGVRYFNPLVTNFFGYTARFAGDVNNDGISDVVVGAVAQNCPDTDGNGKEEFQCGAAYVLYGSSSTPTSDVYTNFTNSSIGFRVLGTDFNEGLGFFVDSAGDFNGDGIDDIIVTAPETHYTGKVTTYAYIIYGQSGTPGDIYVNNMTTIRSRGVRIAGAFQGDYFGFGTSSVGDINGDGTDDVLFAAPKGSLNGTVGGGIVYCLYGQPEYALTEVNLTEGLIYEDGFLLVGAGTVDTRLGFSMSKIDDLNNDGQPDIMIGNPNLLDSDGVLLNGEFIVVYGESTSTNSAGQGSDEDLGLAEYSILMIIVLALLIVDVLLTSHVCKMYKAGQFDGQRKKDPVIIFQDL